MVRFWDTSAIIPLTVIEPSTAVVRSILDSDTSMAVWWATRVECSSALARLLREGEGSKNTVRDARRVIAALVKEWTEVLPTEALRKRAERSLAVHSLRAADALQLAAAMVWARDDPGGHAFVCLDDQLRDAANREGFQLLPGS